MNILSQKRKIAALIIGILIIAVGYNYFSGPAVPAYDFFAVEKKNIIQEVSLTGNVKPAEEVKISFETVGRINRVEAKIGDKVVMGQLLAGVNDSEIRAQLAGAAAQAETAKAQLGQYEAALESQKAKLEEMKSGTRPEEIKIAETAATSAEKALADAQVNLANTKNKAQADIAQVYDGSLTAAAKSVSLATNSIFVAMDIQTAHFSGNNEESNRIADAKSSAIFYLLGGQNASTLSKDAIGQLNGGAKDAIEKARLSPADKNVTDALSELKIAIEKTKALLDAIPITSALTSAETTNLNAEKSSVSNEIITIVGKQNAITVQKAANESAIYIAQTSVNAANNSLLSARDSLALKKAGYTPEQVTAQEAQVRQAEANIVSQKAQIKQAQANVQNYEARLAQAVIRSPIEGIVTKQDAKIGQIVSVNTPVVSVISEKQFQIEANVAEADIAKVKIGDPAKITLDAYGNDIIFEAGVVKIDPAETVIEGVSTYKTTFQFKEEDGRLKSGMTANIDILTAARENAIAIPQRLVIIRGEEKFVKILVNGEIKEIKIKTGLRGSEGNIEITEGISEGDKIITSAL